METFGSSLPFYTLLKIKLRFLLFLWPLYLRLQLALAQCDSYTAWGNSILWNIICHITCTVIGRKMGRSTIKIVCTSTLKIGECFQLLFSSQFPNLAATSTILNTSSFLLYTRSNVSLLRFFFLKKLALARCGKNCISQIFNNY